MFATLMAAASGCGTAHGDEAPAGLLADLAREIHSAPAIAPRLSISGPRPPCIPSESLAPGGPRTPCAATGAGANSARIARISARAAQGIRQSSDVNAIRTAALIDLLFESGGGKSLQRPISSLRTAARLSEHPAPVLADLAAAYLVRAERRGTPRDLLAAIETAQEAREQDPGNRAAAYNLALALQRFGLVEEASEGWRTYLALDSTSAWAREARRNVDAIAAADVPPLPPAADAPESAYAAFAAADPQQARKLGWCGTLGAWAKAVLAGDAAGAEARLRRAEALGGALERRPGGDATLADGARAIRAAGSHGARRLADAHQAFAAGCAALERVDVVASARQFAAAVSAADASPALRSSARVMYGAMLNYAGDPKTAEAVLRQERARSDTVRHPALAADARQALAALLLRGDRHEMGLVQAREAAALYTRIGERQNQGVALDAMSIAYFHMRDMDQGYALAYRALERLRPYRGSYRLHNMLALTGETVANDGFPRAAVAMLNEGVRVAERTRAPAFLAEALLIRARLLAGAGALQPADRDVAAGQAAVARLANPAVRGWMTAQFRITAAATALRTRPAQAAEVLDSATAYYVGMQAPLIVFPTVVSSAWARLAAGEETKGIARLETALEILERRRDSIRMEPRRAAVFDAARELVDRVVMLKLASGSDSEALAYLDRGRASLATVGRPGRPLAHEVPTAPPGEVALQYALIGDTLLVWTVGRQVELFRTAVDTVRLVRTIERLRRQLEERADEAELRPGLAQLYDELVRPVNGRLGAAGTPLVVVADGELASVPFAALFDAERRRYLVEDRPLRFAASLREASHAPPGRRAGGEALFVADPAFDASRHPGFPRLVGAAGEVREIASRYPRARMLADTAATRDALRAALGVTAMMHYAGHAVFDDERPERSYLLLAAVPGQSATRLQAEEIAQMDLRHLSLVVLAACQTVRTGPGRAAGFSGLAGAFLAAGAGGAVGSLWQVDDRLTRALMVEFHRAYRDAGNGPAALRQAQLQLLHSADPSLRSPAAWSGFRYAGS